MATAAAPEPSGGGQSQQARLFVGCVPPQFSEDELKPYFEEVRCFT